MVTLVYHLCVGFFTGMLGTDGCFSLDKE